MNMKYNILIPGAGSFAAICAIKALKKINFNGKIIATDANPLSAGFHLADKSYVFPPITDKNFFEKALEVIKKENVNVILPTSGFDIIPYSKHKKKLQALGVNVIISDYETIKLCKDKWKFYLKFKYKFKIPYTVLDPQKIESFPCFIKPRKGKGSRESFICENASELDYWYNKLEDAVIQEYLPGKEFTIDVLSDLKGNPLFAVPRIRLETKAGISFKGKIALDKSIQDECTRLADELKLIGPSCMQMKLDKDGIPKIIDVNPRMGGGTMFTVLAGANVAEYLLKLLNKEKFKIPKIKEITVLRYYEEIVLNGVQK